MIHHNSKVRVEQIFEEVAAEKEEKEKEKEEKEKAAALAESMKESVKELMTLEKDVSTVII